MRGPHDFQNGDLVYIAETHMVHHRGEVRRVITHSQDGGVFLGHNGYKADSDKCYRFLNVGEVISPGTKVAVVNADGSLDFWSPQKNYCVSDIDAPRILISLPKVNPELEKLKAELDKTQKHFEESRESMKKMREQIRKLELKELQS